ncbi:MAG: DUF2628 domain-containing protein [Bacteroidales bacterium]|nr:DUF2628 domain-containing protein [Bacteroidales bacterium]
MVFVKDGLSWAALLFPLIWLAARRLWLALVLYIVVLVLVNVAFQAAGLPAWAMVVSAASTMMSAIPALSLAPTGVERSKPLQHAGRCS